MLSAPATTPTPKVEVHHPPVAPGGTLVCHQAYRYALDLTPRQQAACASAVGAARFAFNWGLAHVKTLLDQRAAGAQVSVPWSMFALRKAWNAQKRVVAPWWAANSKECYSSGLASLAAALGNYFESRDGLRSGRRVGFPGFRKRGRGRESVRFTTGAIRVEAGRHHVVLPRLGRLRTHESTRKLARHLDQGTARILAATLSRSGGRWWVSFTCEVTRRVPARTPRVVPQVAGVDVGVRQLAVVADGAGGVRLVANPAALTAAQTRLRRLNRRLARRDGPRGPDGARRPPSAGWRQTRRQLGRVHARVANVRGDAWAQLTSQLVRTSDVVVVEQLHVAGLVRRGRGKRGVNRAIADAGLAELRRRLRYQTPWAGVVLVEADRFYPSSKTCSGCGAVNATLPASHRRLHCDSCGLVVDRDVNAARNLAALASGVRAEASVTTVAGVQQGGAGSGPGPQPPGLSRGAGTARGGRARPHLGVGHRPLKREAGTSHP